MKIQKLLAAMIIGFALLLSGCDMDTEAREYRKTDFSDEQKQEQESKTVSNKQEEKTSG